MALIDLDKQIDVNWDTTWWIGWDDDAYNYPSSYKMIAFNVPPYDNDGDTSSQKWIPALDGAYHPIANSLNASYIESVVEWTGVLSIKSKSFSFDSNVAKILDWRIKYGVYSMLPSLRTDFTLEHSINDYVVWSQLANNWLLYFAYIYTSGGNTVLKKYTLSTAYDLSTMTLSQNITMPENVKWFNIDNSWTKIITASQEYDQIREYTLWTARDITSLSLTNSYATGGDIFSSQDTIYVNANWTKAYLTEYNSPNTFMYEYTLWTARDVSTISYIQSQTNKYNTENWWTLLNNSWTKLYSRESDTVYEYTLSTPWNIASWGWVIQSETFADSISGFCFDSTWDNMFPVIRSWNDSMLTKIPLVVQYDIDNESFASVSFDVNLNINGILYFTDNINFSWVWAKSSIWTILINDEAVWTTDITLELSTSNITNPDPTSTKIWFGLTGWDYTAPTGTNDASWDWTSGRDVWANGTYLNIELEAS